jgi:hypothetical protein
VPSQWICNSVISSSSCAFKVSNLEKSLRNLPVHVARMCTLRRAQKAPPLQKPFPRWCPFRGARRVRKVRSPGDIPRLAREEIEKAAFGIRMSDAGREGAATTSGGETRSHSAQLGWRRGDRHRAADQQVGRDSLRGRQEGLSAQGRAARHRTAESTPARSPQVARANPRAQRDGVGHTRPPGRRTRAVAQTRD